MRESLADFTRDRMGVSRTEARSFVSGFFRIFADYVRSHGFTEIRGFGAFRWVTCKKRECRNGGLFGKRTIPSYRKLVFHSKSMRNGKNEND